jgi:hypothetical protein
MDKKTNDLGRPKVKMELEMGMDFPLLSSRGDASLFVRFRRFNLSIRPWMKSRA